MSLAMPPFCCCWTTWNSFSPSQGAITWHTNWQASLAVRAYVCFSISLESSRCSNWLFKGSMLCFPAISARFDIEELKTSRTLLFGLAGHSLSDSLSWKSRPALKPGVHSVSDWDCFEMRGVDWVSSSTERAAVASTLEVLRNIHRKS